MLLKLCFKNNYSWIFGALYQSINGKTQPPKRPKFRFGHGKWKSERLYFLSSRIFWSHYLWSTTIACFFLEKQICRYLRALSEVAKTQNNKKPSCKQDNGTWDADCYSHMWFRSGCLLTRSFSIKRRKAKFHIQQKLLSQWHHRILFHGNFPALDVCFSNDFIPTLHSGHWVGWNPCTRRRDKDKARWNTVQADWEPDKAASR